MATFPTRLKLARENAGLTKLELSKRTGIDKSQLTRWEQGARFDGVQLATIVKLAQALGQPLGWLAANEGQPAPAALVFRESTDRRRKANRDKPPPDVTPGPLDDDE